MCGIGGFIDNKQIWNEETLHTINRIQRHRGPDSSGIWLEQVAGRNVGLAHARLAIIDESNGGHQPMKRAELYIVFNGEIYNYQEIRDTLAELGQTFETKSDTEVILAAYQQWGIACVERFIGMFAFCLVDKSQNKSFIVRDRVGVKPLYYSLAGEHILFSSELKVMHHLLTDRSIDRTALALYLKHGYVPAPYTILKEAKKLPPGHYLELDLTNFRISELCYWDVLTYYQKPKKKLEEGQYLQELETLLKSASQYRMVSDVPVGIFLSGGYDSSCVTALLQKDTSKPLKTFTIGFSDSVFDESRYARVVSEYLGTEHTEYICSESDVRNMLPSMSFNFDEPFADSSGIPTMLVSKLAREKVTVALSADGGDELFGGYSRYDTYRNLRAKLNRIPRALNKPLAIGMKLAQPLYSYVQPKEAYRRALNFELLAEALMNGNLKASSIMKEMSTLIPEKWSRNLLEETYSRDRVSNFGMAAELLTDLTQTDSMLALDFLTYLPDDILCKVDRATMHVSLEGREPLLDHRLIEYMAQVPDEWKIRNGEKKYLLKQIVHKHIPPKMMERKKMGFGIPVHNWLRDHYRDWLEELFSEEALNHGLFNSRKVREILKSYLEGDRLTFDAVWSLFMFQVWYREWMSLEFKTV